MLRYHRVVSCTQDTMMTHNNILERHDYTCVSIEYDLLEIEKVEKGLTLQIVCVFCLVWDIIICVQQIVFLVKKQLG